jgi:hypothetical protein
LLADRAAAMAVFTASWVLRVQRFGSSAMAPAGSPVSGSDRLQS